MQGLFTPSGEQIGGPAWNREKRRRGVAFKMQARWISITRSGL
jgi:hypothetical protein